jgi:mannonate dehydratase
MRTGIATYRPITDDLLALVKQSGVDDILLKPNRYDGVETVMPLGRVWEVDELVTLRERIEDAGTRLYAFEKRPIPLYDVLTEATTRSASGSRGSSRRRYTTSARPEFPSWDTAATRLTARSGRRGSTRSGATRRRPRSSSRNSTTPTN